MCALSSEKVPFGREAADAVDVVVEIGTFSRGNANIGRKLVKLSVKLLARAARLATASPMKLTILTALCTQGSTHYTQTTFSPPVDCSDGPRYKAE